MSSTRRRTTIVIVAAAIAGGGGGLVLGLTEDDEDPPATTAASPAGEAVDPETGAAGDQGAGSGQRNDAGGGQELPPPEDDPQGLEPGPSGPAPSTEDERAAATATRSYIAAIDSRSGGEVCGSFAAGALDGFDFPAGRGSCANRAKASLGFGGRGGQPVWKSSETTKAISAEISGDTARVVATVFTTYEDVREPTIEDDIVYLVRDGNGWKVAQPSLTLYRATGDSDVPPSALAPPG